jgi:glutamate racemase
MSGLAAWGGGYGVWVRAALINSGLGLLGAAAALRELDPVIDLVLSLDPEGMPWGPRPALGVGSIVERTMLTVRAAMSADPDVMVVACNSASVHALALVRAELEPAVPVIGTVPAVRPAALAGSVVAVWSTQATATSHYLQELIAAHAASRTVATIACPGLADAVDAGDLAGAERAAHLAAASTPSDVSDVVLGCTEYELVADVIAAALPTGVRVHGSAPAIARQAVTRARRADDLASCASGQLDVLLSGRPGQLPPAAFTYSAGRRIATSRKPFASPGATTRYIAPDIRPDSAPEGPLIK